MALLATIVCQNLYYVVGYMSAVKNRIRLNPFWALFGLCMLNLLFMHYYIAFTSRVEWIIGIMSYIDNFLAVIVDVGILFFFFYLLTWKRQKPALYICFVITWLWSFSNVLYSRFFSHYITLSAIGQIGSLFDETVQGSLMDGFRWIDLYYPLCLALFVYLAKYFVGLKSLFKKLALFFVVFVALDICYFTLFFLAKPERRKLDKFFTELYTRHFPVYVYSHSPSYTSFLRGSFFSFYDELALMHRGTMQLSATEKGIIETVIDDSKSSISLEGNGVGTKNLIFILVESYMSFTSDMLVEGREVTPFLNALKHDSIVCYNGQIQDNTTLGASSDGQFIYMTGLLPLRPIVTVSKARDVILPGLPKILGMESRMIIPTIASLWKQTDMCKQYGFDYLYTTADYPGKHKTNLNDEQVFELAMQKDKDSASPFFSVILTMTMHHPYIYEIDETFKIKDPSVPKELKCYLNACHYTDRQIGKYLEHLKATGLFDNSLIVIASDHPAHAPAFGDVSDDLPLYIVNVDEKAKETWYHGRGNQMDVYTTLLDLYGIESNWYGLGHSLFSPHYKNSLTEQKWDVSEWILYSDYFKTAPTR